MIVIIVITTIKKISATFSSGSSRFPLGALPRLGQAKDAIRSLDGPPECWDRRLPPLIPPDSDGASVVSSAGGRGSRSSGRRTWSRLPPLRPSPLARRDGLPSGSLCRPRHFGLSRILCRWRLGGGREEGRFGLGEGGAAMSLEWSGRVPRRIAFD